MTSLQFCCRKCYSTHGINSIHSIAFPQKNHEESPHFQKAFLAPQCLFVKKVDSPKFNEMKEKDYEHKRFRQDLMREIYRLVKRDHVPVVEVSRRYGVDPSNIYRRMCTFERENPKEAELMRKGGKENLPEDYKRLLEELSELRKELEKERLRADFYQEMVAYGKEVYGIDLKKAGTK